jgi:ABC-type nickel/cobalt efflux system permease component RcnA
MRRLSLFLAFGLFLLAVGWFVTSGGGLLNGVILETRHIQSTMQSDLTQAVRAWQSAPGLGTLMALVAVCFLYGVFHAVGPGHGKAVISAYAATADIRMGQVFLLSAATAMVQATVAVVVIALAIFVIGSGVYWVTTQPARLLEPVSYGAIALIGGWMIFGALRRFLPRRKAAAPDAVAKHDHGHSHGHHHDDGHDHHHDGACCGHNHAPPPPADGRSGLVLALAAGLRPCSGSLLVVWLCFSAQLWGMGIAASYAIGVGTALTVALLAGSVRAVRGPMVFMGRLARLPDSVFRRVAFSARLIGGLLILAFGLVMLNAALTTPKPPL